MGTLRLGQQLLDTQLHFIRALRESGTGQINDEKGQHRTAAEGSKIGNHEANCIAVNPEKPRAIRPAVMKLMAAP